MRSLFLDVEYHADAFERVVAAMLRHTATGSDLHAAMAHQRYCHRALESRELLPEYVAMASRVLTVDMSEAVLRYGLAAVLREVATGSQDATHTVAV